MYNSGPVCGGAEGHENDPGGSRTRDLRIKSPLLYQLSYRVRRTRRASLPPHRPSSLESSDLARRSPLVTVLQAPFVAAPKPLIALMEIGVYTFAETTPD